MKMHEVAVWPSFLAEMADRVKCSRIDVGFVVGDDVLFRVWWAGAFTGDEKRMRVVAIERPAELPAWVVMTLEDDGAYQMSLDDDPEVEIVEVVLPDPDESVIGAFSDPETSGAPETQREAAISAYSFTAAQQRVVLDAIGTAGADGMTDDEVEVKFDLRHQSASARRNRLLNDGWIEDSEQRRLTRSGRRAVVWVLTEQGRKEWTPNGGSA